MKTVPTDNELKFHYTVHTSLDVVEEKISSVGKNTGDIRELYLGLLYPTEDYKVYPFKQMILTPAHKDWVCSRPLCRPGINYGGTVARRSSFCPITNCC